MSETMLSAREIIKKVLVNEGKGVSFSRLTLADCLHAFRERYVLERPEEETEAAQFGGFVHELAERGLMEGIDPSRIADATAEKYPLVPGYRIGEAVYMARNALARAERSFKVEVEKTFVKELLEIDGHAVCMNGRVDRLEMNPFDPKVVDLKTGVYFNPARTHQLPLYFWGLGLDEGTGVLHFLRFDEWAETPIDRCRIEAALEWARKQVARVYEAALKNEWPAAECEHCKYCGFRDTCPIEGKRCPRSLEEATRLASEAFRLKERVSELEMLVRAYVEATGTPVPIEAEGGEGKVYDFSPSNEYEFDVARVLDFCIENGLPLAEVLSINYRGVKKHLSRGLDAVVKVKPSTPRFGVKSKFSRNGKC